VRTELSRRGLLKLSALALCTSRAQHAGAGTAAVGCIAPLAARYPALLQLPLEPLGSFPTPVDVAADLGEQLGVRQLWVKRDDVSGSYGGGKTRKLETLLGEAKATGASRVATVGGFGSNHCVAVAHYAAKLGLECELYVLAERKSEHAKQNLRAMLRTATSVQVAGSIRDALRMMGRGRASEESRPFVIAAGGSSALGTVPFVAAAFEIAEQVEQGVLPRPDIVLVAAGTLGTAAGLGVGFAALGWDTEVRAVRASSPGTSSPSVLRRLVRETQERIVTLVPGFPVGRAVKVRIDGRELGRGYAYPTAGAQRARELARDHAGLALEVTYTAKALAAAQHDATALGNRRVLFWHSASSRPLDTSLAPENVPRVFRAFLA